MKKINSFIFPLFLSFAILFTLNDVYASSTLTVGSRVDITVSVTKANIHYQLVRKTGENFLDNINVKMIKNSNQIIMNENIEAGKISPDRQEFGDYEIIIDENGKYETRYKFTIDEEYLKTQDEIKKIVLNEKIEEDKNQDDKKDNNQSGDIDNSNKDNNVKNDGKKDNITNNADKNKDNKNNESSDQKDSKVENSESKSDNNKSSVENTNSKNDESVNQADGTALSDNAGTNDKNYKYVILFSAFLLSSLWVIIKMKKPFNIKGTRCQSNSVKKLYESKKQYE